MKPLAMTLVLLGAANAAAQSPWTRQAIAATADFRGLAVVDARVAWVGGSKGAIGRTTDGGMNWQVLAVPDAETLDFRAIKAFGERTAYALSIGAGEASRIYKTTDGGKLWQLQFKNPDRDAFYDALAFWEEQHGLALSDPVNGFYRLIRTDDGGKSWQPLPTDAMPAALPKEGAFAASGTCLVARGDREAWFVTGGGPHARLFHTADRGQTWSVTVTPVVGGVESAGAFSIAFRDDKRGMIVGGDYTQPKATGATAAVTADGGTTWTLLAAKLPFRSAVVWAGDRWLAVGTSGADMSTDDGATWTSVNTETINSIGMSKSGTGWAAGPKGYLAKIAIER